MAALTAENGTYCSAFKQSHFVKTRYFLLVNRHANACCAIGRAAGQARALPFTLRLPKGKVLAA